MSNSSERHIHLPPNQHYKLTAQEFGMEGLIAIESIGPFVRHKAVGPLITVHDSVIFAGKGIGHHPHHGNERLFYVEKGEFDHDDALNHVQGHAEQGDMARFTEGQQGMIHKEWNNGDEDAEIFILVASTQPTPEDMMFEVLKSEQMSVETEVEGVQTRYMVGGATDFKIYSDIKTFTDTSFIKAVDIDWKIPTKEGGLLSVRDGEVTVNGQHLERKSTYIVPPSAADETVKVKGSLNSRIIRTTFGEGYGLQTD